VEASSRLYSTAALPLWKDSRIPIEKAGWAPEPVWTLRREKSLAPAWNQTPNIQPVVRRYTDWAPCVEPSRSKYNPMTRQFILSFHFASSCSVSGREVSLSAAVLLWQRTRPLLRPFGQFRVTVPHKSCSSLYFRTAWSKAMWRDGAPLNKPTISRRVPLDLQLHCCHSRCRPRSTGRQ
jgi:hypothetical protein